MISIYQKLRTNSMARSTLALLATRALSILIGVALSVLLARWLAPAGYGDYLFTLSMAQVLAIPILAGLPALVVREVAIARGSGDAEGLAGILRWSTGFVLLTSLVVAGLAAIVFLFGSQDGEAGLGIYLLAVPLVLALASLRLGSAVVQGCEHPFAGNLGDGLIRPVLLLLMVCIFAMTGLLGTTSALWLHIAAAAAAAGFAFSYWLFVCRKQIGLQRQAPRYETRKWLASLLPLSLVTAASLINSRLDILMLGVLSKAEDVAHYGIAVQLAGLVLMGQTIVNSIVAPKIARLYRQSEHAKMSQMITQAARISATIALSVFLFIFFFGAIIIEVLLGVEYAGTWLIALILCGGNLITSALGPVAKVMDMTGNERVMAKLVWFSALANGVMNVVLVPLYGAVGAAAATLIALLIHQVFMLYWIGTRLRIDTTILGRLMSTK